MNKRTRWITSILLLITFFGAISVAMLVWVRPMVGNVFSNIVNPIDNSYRSNSSNYAQGTQITRTNPPNMTPPNGEPFADMYFEHYGVNPFIDTEDDSLSTFALDVDTGSYTIMRRYLWKGSLPDKDSVRVEEYLNAFNYDYSYPEEGTFTLHLDGGSTPFTVNDNYRVLRIGIQGYDLDATERKPVVLTFVIDVSGSMDMEDRLGAVKMALTALVDGLRPTDQVGIVAFSDTAWVVLPTTPVGERIEILNAIQRLYPLESTNAEAGLRLGYQMARDAFQPVATNRIILCSDGVANTGLTSHDAIFKLIDLEARSGISLTTIGVGMGNYNDVLLEQLADQGDGMYAYIDGVEELERLFVDGLTGLLQTIAKDARIQVSFNPETVSRYRLIGFENRAVDDDAFLDDSTDAGEVGAGHSVTALYEVKLVTGAQGEMARVSLRWLDPDSGVAEMMEASIAVEDFAGRFEETSSSFQLAALVAAYAEILRESYWAQEQTLDNLVPWLAALENDPSLGGQALDFMQMLERAVRLANQA